ncbi:hypothetical protein HNR42_003447 [Deinobacterium chartae]|uniref:DUF6916 domain-containing protein n=1 Tax=Deinobacterium chartae TaxID=521158 RepID=A0A841I4N2_9DEIO|nr:hypothetical protein [Deinobacterium chartae]MBB6099986.1 hypothetical protein [Deinobacterium chartae]
MSDNLTLDHFTPLVGEYFRLHATPEQQLCLTEARALGRARPESGSEAFALSLIGPAEPWAPQGIWRLEHPKLGVLELFMVPNGPDSRGMRYEIVFN